MAKYSLLNLSKNLKQNFDLKWELSVSRRVNNIHSALDKPTVCLYDKKVWNLLEKMV